MKVKVTEDLNAIKYFSMNNDSVILSWLLNDLGFLKDPTIRTIMNLRSPMKLPKYDALKGWRTLDEGVKVPLGTQGKFSNREIKPYTMMKILEVLPQQFRDTFYSDQIGPNAKDFPGGFAEYFWRQQMAVGADEINDGAFMGIDPDDIADFNPASTYAAGFAPANYVKFELVSGVGQQSFRCIGATSAGQSPTTHPAKWVAADNETLVKGWGTIIKAEYSGLPATNKINTGAITNTTACAQLKTMYRALPEKMRNKNRKVIAYCSLTTFEKYEDDFNERYVKGVQVADEKVRVVRETNGNCILNPVTWMAGHPGVIMTPERNLVVGTNQVNDFASIGKAIETHHGYSVIQKAMLAFQIADLQVLHVNDQGWT